MKETRRMKSTLGLIVLLMVAAGLWALSPAARSVAAPAVVVTFTVDNPNDLLDNDTSDGVCTPGSCSLRAAVMQANQMTGPGVNIILPSGTYTLTRPPLSVDGDDSGDLNLSAPLSGHPVISILGAGAATTFIDGYQQDRVFHVEAGRTAFISGVTIRDGLNVQPYLAGGGGGIKNDGTLTLLNCVLSANQSGDGGGLQNHGQASVSLCAFSGNRAGLGGGIYNNGTLTLTQSTISSNSVTFSGGGLYNAPGGLLAMGNSTLTLNSADGDGGGIYNYGTAQVYNTTIVANDADHDQDGGSAGGVYNDANATFSLRNTLIAGNTFANSPQYAECTGTLGIYGINLIGFAPSPQTCTFTGSGIVFPLNALDYLGQLRNNGGATETIALLQGNNGIDSGVGLGCIGPDGAPLSTDQRGAARFTDGDGDGIAICDIGAFEYRPPLLLPLIQR
jgi:hypothetical protein